MPACTVEVPAACVIVRPPSLGVTRPLPVDRQWRNLGVYRLRVDGRMRYTQGHQHQIGLQHIWALLLHGVFSSASSQAGHEWFRMRCLGHMTRQDWRNTRRAPPKNGARSMKRLGRNLHQLPPPPPPPPPPENPPPPKPLDEPELGGENAIALEMLEFIDWRLFASSVAWNGPGPTYQLFVAVVSMPSNAFAHRLTLPKTIA